MRNIFPFLISNQIFALPLHTIVTVVRAVELVRLPEAATGLVGLLDLRGALVPVLDIRRRLNLPPCELRVEQRLVVARRADATVAFMADQVESVLDLTDERLTAAAEIYPALDHYVTAVAWHDEQKILICDPETFLYVDPDLLRESPCETIPQN